LLKVVFIIVDYIHYIMFVWCPKANSSQVYRMIKARLESFAIY